MNKRHKWEPANEYHPRTLKKQLDYIKRLEESVKRRENRRYDERNPGETGSSSLSRNTKYFHKRMAQLPKNLTCPTCLLVCPNSNQWCVNPDKRRNEQICKSCAQTISRARKMDKEMLALQITREQIVSNNRVYGRMLRAKRLQLGVSAAAFGQHCGWGDARQRNLERLESQVVAYQTAQALNFVLDKLEQK